MPRTWTGLLLAACTEREPEYLDDLARCEAWREGSALGALLSVECRSSGAHARARSLAAVSPQPFEYVGPGSMGYFGDYHAHPTHPDVLFAGGDPGGIFLSSDGGTSWTNVTLNLPTNSVWALELVVFDQGASAERTRVVIGTDSGIFYSDDVSSAAGMSARSITGWTEAGGFRVGDQRPDDSTIRELTDYNKSLFSLPIGAIEVDPTNPQVLWAGITGLSGPNLAQSVEDDAGVQRFDKWKVYRSMDGGQTWTPVLRFSAPVPSFPQTPYDADGSVFSILASPHSPGSVWVASDRGLYATSKGLETTDSDADGVPDIAWRELGTAAPRTTADGGKSWTDTQATCVDHAADPSAGAWCLPVVSTANVGYVIDPDTGEVASGPETHPNLRGLAGSRIGSRYRLYATIWDRGHASDQGPGCSGEVEGDTFDDSALTFLRGGLYASDDGGETWRWLFTSTGAPGGVPYLTELRYRCDATTSESNSTGKISYFPTLSVPATSRPSELALLGGLGAEGGLYAYTGSSTLPWTYLMDPDDADFEARFEGDSPHNISGAGTVGVARIVADWSQTTDGYPLVLFSVRGVLLGSWSPERQTYEFTHLGSDVAGVSDQGLTVWEGTGLDNAVTWDVVEVDGTLYVGVSDGGVLKGEEVDGGFFYVGESRALWTPNWSDDPDDYRDDEARALAWDPERGTLYAGTYVSSTGTQYSVFAGDRTSWRIIGGYGYVSDASERKLVGATYYNGFYSGSASTRLETNALLPLESGSGTDAELLAATSAGLFSYASTRPAGQQWLEACADLAQGHKLVSLVRDDELVPGWAFATMGDVNLGGLLAIRLSDLSCQALTVEEYVDPASGRTKTGKDPIRYPSCAALTATPEGEARLVVGATFHAYPGLFSAEIACDERCALSAWAWPVTGEGVYAEGSTRDYTMRRLDIDTIAVYPPDKSVVWAALDTAPAYDYYNPQYLYLSEDGGLTFESVDFESADYNLPSRGVNMLEFSEDGAWLYAASRASLYRMPVGW